MQSMLPKTRRLLAITTMCVLATVGLMDFIVVWLPAHPQHKPHIRVMALVSSVAVAALLAWLMVRARRLFALVRAAHWNEQRFLAASESSYDSFFILESVRDGNGEIADFRFAYANANAASLLSSTPRDLQGKLLCVNYPVNRTGGFFDTYKRVVETGERVRAEFPIHAKNVRASWLSHQVVKLEDGIAITTSDITDAKQKELLLLYLAQHDSLTGLARRSLFDEQMAAALQQAEESQRHVGLLMLDCDDFKHVNDLQGHGAGDELLTQVAKRLVDGVRKSDTVARMGGDEFLIVLGDLTDQRDAAEIAAQLLLAVQQPMTIAGQPMQMTASIGVAVYPRDGGAASDLMKNADAAMYQAKADGRNRVQVFTAEMAASLARRRKLETALQHALERGEFVVHYQPRVNLLTGMVTGVEALLRWDHAELGRVSPAEFIPLAEANGMIVPIGRWVLETACREIGGLYPVRSLERHAGRGSALISARGRGMQLAVNVSPRQFQQGALVRELTGALERSGMEPESLEIEITENLLLHESLESKSTFEAVRALGVSIAIDDFGTGYSSMSYLMRFRAERLKIDQSFVRRMTFDAESAAICKALVGLAKALNIWVVAEGVETEKHRDLLWQLGCEEAQGYLYSAPVPIAELDAVVEAIERRAVRQFAA